VTSAWIATLCLSFLACAARVIAGSWLAPSAFAAAVWSLYLAVPLVIAPEYPVSGTSEWIIVALIACMSLGAMLTEGHKTRLERKAAIRAASLWRWSLLLTAVAFVGYTYQAIHELRNHGLDFSLTGLFLLGGFQTFARYELQIQPPLLIRLLTTWLFPAAILAGISYASSKRRFEKFLCFAPAAVGLFGSVVNATKANTLMVIALALCGYMSVRVSANFKVRKKNALLKLAVLAVLGMSFFSVVDMLRSNKPDAPAVMDTGWSRIKAATFGYLSLFDYWMVHREDFGPSEFSAGAYTFGGVLEAVGIHHREVGIFREFVALGEDQSNNIYSAFRGVIQDFSLPGAGVFFLCFGLFAGYAYRRCSSAGAYGYAPILAGFYVFLIWSPLGSIFVYNGSILALLVAWMFLRRVSGSENVATVAYAAPNPH